MRALCRFISVIVLATAFLPAAAPSAHALSTSVVIFEIYGGGGNSGSYYQNDFVVLHNQGPFPVDVSTWSIQYASAAGTTWQRTSLTGSIPAGGYYLIQEAQGVGGTSPLPTPEVTGVIPMSATTGKVALLSNQNTLAYCYPNCVSSPGVVDFVGYGIAANEYETAAAPSPSNSTAIRRGSSGCAETDSNTADFTAGDVVPFNGATPVVICWDAAPSVSTTVPTADGTDVAAGAVIEVTFTEPVNLAWDPLTLTCTLSGEHTSYATTGGPTTFSFTPDVPIELGESCTATVLATAVTDQEDMDPPDAMVADHTWSFTTLPERGADLAIRKAGDTAWVGEGVVNDGTGQARTVRLRPRRTATFDLLVTNAGHPEADDITIQSPVLVGSKGFKVTFLHGSENATSSVVSSGGHVCPAIPSLGSDQMTLKVRASKSAKGLLRVEVNGYPDGGGTGDVVLARVRVRN